MYCLDLDFEIYGNSKHEVLSAYVKRLVDQRLGLAHFHSEEVLGKHAEVDTVRLLGELHCLALVDYETNV